MKLIVEAVNGVPHFGKMIWKIKCSTVYKMEQFTQEFLSHAKALQKNKMNFWVLQYA